MNGRRVGQYLLLLLLAYLLIACQRAPIVHASQSVLEWPEQRLLFVADSRQGKVQSFLLAGDGTPVPFAQTHDPQRSSVRDLKLDVQRGRLWVLGAEGVFVHKARGLVLQKHLVFDTRKVASLVIDGDWVWLLDESGRRVAQIDAATLTTSAQAVGRRG